jgi:hypothetical protein
MIETSNSINKYWEDPSWLQRLRLVILTKCKRNCHKNAQQGDASLRNYC